MSFMYTLSSSSSSVLYTHIHIFSEYKTFSTRASLSLFYLLFLEDKTWTTVVLSGAKHEQPFVRQSRQQACKCRLHIICCCNNYLACRLQKFWQPKPLTYSQQTRDGEEYVINKVGWRCICRNNETHVGIFISLSTKEATLSQFVTSWSTTWHCHIDMFTCSYATDCIQALIFGETSGAFMSCTCICVACGHCTVSSDTTYKYNHLQYYTKCRMLPWK